MYSRLNIFFFNESFQSSERYSAYLQAGTKQKKPNDVRLDIYFHAQIVQKDTNRALLTCKLSLSNMFERGLYATNISKSWKISLKR